MKRFLIHSTLIALGLTVLPLAPLASAQTEILRFGNDPNSFFFGRFMGTVGDHDGDGVQELGVFSLSVSLTQHFDIYCARTGVLRYRVPLGTGHGAGSYEPAGDVDGDGTEDFIYTDAGALDRTVVVMSSATYQIIRTHYRSVGVFSFDAYGDVLAGGQDLDNDGLSDYFINDPFNGLACVHSGATGAVLYTLPSVTDAVMLDDVNADGRSDFAIGTNQSVQVYSGMDGALLYTVGGSDGFGAAIDALNDLNGDGIPELLVGAPDADFSGPDTGSTYVLSGVDGQTLGRLDAAPGMIQFGVQVRRAGDTNGDGFEDFTVGAKTQITDSTATSHSLFSGRFVDHLYTFEAATLGMLADRAAPLGDVNGDGLADVALGIPGSNNGEVSVRAGSELYLHAPDIVAGGSSLTLRTAGGEPGRRCVLFLEAVNGIPVNFAFQPIGTLDALGSYGLTGMPKGPVQLQFRSYARNAAKQVVSSGQEIVTVQ